MAETAQAEISGVPPHPGFSERYPWHRGTWSALMRDPARLAHALLLHGPEGLGKRAFAWRLARALLCLAPGADADACGQCRACVHFAAGTHPDLRHVAPLEDSRTIAIDQIRALREFAALTPHTSQRKLALIEPAEAMTLSAANALLKILEEPPAGSVLVLVAARPARLPATIRSRCAAVPFRPPAQPEAAAWLQERGVAQAEAALALAGGAPLGAAALAGAGELEAHERFLLEVEALRTGRLDPLACAARWKSHGAERCLFWLQRYLGREIRVRMEQAAGGENARSTRDLFRYLDVVSEMKALVPGPLDELLVLEDIAVAGARLLPQRLPKMD